MTAQIIQFVPRPNPNRKTLEQQAQELAKEFNRMAEEGTEVVCEMVGRNSLPMGPVFVAPPEDCA